jgi:hypothetical protein
LSSLKKKKRKQHAADGIRHIHHATSGQIIIKESPLDHKEQNYCQAPVYYITNLLSSTRLLYRIFFIVNGCWIIILFWAIKWWLFYDNWTIIAMTNVPKLLWCTYMMPACQRLLPINKLCKMRNNEMLMVVMLTFTLLYQRNR